jgi:hypothetical protein
MISWIRVVWMIFSVIASYLVAREAYQNPIDFVGLIDLFATILSILIGVSLALTAVLSTKPTSSEHNFKSRDEQKRVDEIVAQDDAWIIEGQHILFWLYYIALLLALASKWFSRDADATTVDLLLSLLISAFMFVACLAFLMSANLPMLLRQVTKQRKEL